MGSGEGGQERVFDAFRVGGFVELLEAGDFGGVGELLGMEGKVPAVEREGAEAGGFLLRYDSAAYAPPLSSSYRLPCFAGDEQGFQNNGGNNNNNNGFSHKSGESCSTTTSSSSSNSGGRPSKPKKAEQRREYPSAAAERGRTAAAITKKPRKEQPQGQQRPPPSSQRRTSKVRKEKLGERINALQQLVSPFGKTDTASVLHEALGYIRFLHDQVQGVAEARPDLRSRGLCLVPVACTAQVAASNGADLWSPAAMGSCGDDQHRQPAGLSKY